jgi:hypothetical protein
MAHHRGDTVSGYRQGQKPADACGVRWCDEIHDHECPHRGYVLDFHAPDADTLRPVLVQLVKQGESARTIVPVLIVNGQQVGLVWKQARELSTALNAVVADARRLDPGIPT